MNEPIKFTIDGQEITAHKGQTIMEAADDAGVYIPRLCWLKDLAPGGNCRICTVKVQGRAQAACTHPVTPGMAVEHDTADLAAMRKQVVEMLLVEGNHFCPICERSGSCELQAMAYRMGITTPRYPYMFPKRELDATHPNVFLDRNRCIQCGRCIRASRLWDGKSVFQFVHRSNKTEIAVNADGKLGETDLAATDRAIDACPVGAIVRKGVGFSVPIGQRKYDHEPIGTDTEARRPKGTE